MNTGNTAILFFSRSAQAEIIAKGWQNEMGSKKAFRVIHRLISNTKNLIQSSSYPVFFSNEHDQKGRNFKEKLYNSIDKVFKHGFDKVIAIGNDCAELSNRDITDTHQALFSDDIVLGKTQKGGVYIFGITRKAHMADVILKINWQSNKVVESTLKLEGCSISLLGEKSEYHSFAELIHLFRRKKLSASIKLIVKQFIAKQRNFAIENSSFSVLHHNSAIIMRGPPTLCS